MLGKTVKGLRTEKAWSQSHLADAAGLSVRTIQRVEREGHCSSETLLSLAAAFDVDVQHLTQKQLVQVAPVAEPEERSTRSFWPEIQPKHAAWWGGILIIPSLFFVLSNVLKYTMDLPQLYDTLATLGDVTGLDAYTGFLTSPLLLLGAPALAVLLNVLAQVRVSGDKTDEGITVRGITFSFNLVSTLILVGCLACLVVLLGYATMENLSDWIFDVANR